MFRAFRTSDIATALVQNLRINTNEDSYEKTRECRSVAQKNFRFLTTD